ncbi:MAG: LysR family transcriptional regulator [Clostridiales bacterium]|nr:LysR family transcriptional regulator [Clostridiales bacterium]
MEILQLEHLLMIEQNKSMRSAAEKAFMSQPALSHGLKKLEHELDCQLFDRIHNQLCINVYGEIMLKHSRRIMQEIEEAKREIAEEQMRQAKKISIGCYSYAFQCHVLPQLANVLKQNLLECQTLDYTHLAKDFQEDSLDVVFTDKAYEGEGIKTVRLFNEQVMISLPSSSEFASRQCIYISDLNKLNMYLATDATGYTDWFVRILNAAGISAPLSGSAPFREYLYNKDSMEKCQLTSSFIMRFVPTAPRRVVIPLADGMASRDIFMSYKQKNEERLMQMISSIEKNHEVLFYNNGYLPYFLFPTERQNLFFINDKYNLSPDSKTGAI